MSKFFCRSNFTGFLYFVPNSSSGIVIRWSISDYPNTVWKVSKYGVISGPYFTVFGLNTEGLKSEYREIQTRNNSEFGRFSHSVSESVVNMVIYVLHIFCLSNWTKRMVYLMTKPSPQNIFHFPAEENWWFSLSSHTNKTSDEGNVVPSRRKTWMYHNTRTETAC